jgi:hypothetical protein
MMQRGRAIWVSCLLLWLGAADLHAREVMSWVPPYAIDECKTTLQSDFGDFSPSNALTRLGLQFWIPTVTGGVVKTTEYGTIHDSDIAWVQDWGSDNRVEILLCVYNLVSGDNASNWDLALSAFSTNRSTFVSNLVQTVQAYNLDGIDIDLEGPTNSDRPAFKLFLEELSAQLNPLGKTLTVDSFHSPIYSAPNMSWWEDWTNLVDAVHVMGYTDLFEGSTQVVDSVSGLFKYSWQQNYGLAAGLRPEQISLGLPGNVANWGYGGRGSNCLDHIEECIYDCTFPASVCIWDIQLDGTEGATNWRSSVVWERLAQLAEYQSIPIDDDDDNMADVWEIRHFGGTNEVDCEAAEDKDHDGYSNIEEYVAGTDPTNNASVFSLAIQNMTGGAVEIAWWAQRINAFDAAYGDQQRYYSLERSSELLPADWVPVPGRTNLLADDRILRYTNSPAVQIEFYRGGSSLR